MGIEKGSSTFKLVAAAEKIGEEIMPVLKEKAYLDMPPGEVEKLSDITRGVSIANGKPQDEWDFRYGTSIYFAIRTRERVVDPKMVKEYLAYLMDKEFKETGKIPRGKRKKELKETAKSMVQTNLITKVSGARIIIPVNTKMVIMELSSDKKVDEAIEFLTENAFKENALSTITPEYLYNVLTGQPCDSYKGFSVADEERCTGLGADFLTWLWMASEVEGMLPKGIRSTPFGDVEFRNDKDCPKGAITIKMSKGMPWEGEEPKAALVDGKKICAASFRFMKDDTVSYDVVIDETFTFKKFEVSKGQEEELENPEDIFSDAIMSIQLFSELFIELFKTFLSRVDSNESDIRNWYNSRWSEE